MPIKAWRFSFSLSFDYFNEPCTTAIVKKSGTTSICKPSRCYHFAHDSIFLVSYSEKGLVEHHFFGRENKKVQTSYTFLSTWHPLFSFYKKGFGCFDIYYGQVKQEGPLEVQSSTKIVGFPKLYVHHIGSSILNSANPMSNSQSATPKVSEYRVLWKSCGFHNCMSDIWDIRDFAKGMAIWDGETVFSCSLTIPITVDHS